MTDFLNNLDAAPDLVLYVTVWIAVIKALVKAAPKVSGPVRKSAKAIQALDSVDAGVSLCLSLAIMVVTSYMLGLQSADVVALLSLALVAVCYLLHAWLKMYALNNPEPPLAPGTTKTSYWKALNPKI